MLRLVGRIAVIPGPSRAAAVRLELAAQVHASQPTASDVFALPRATTLLEQGEVFDALTLRADLEPGFAYAITAESPGVLWRDLPPTDQEDPRDLNPDPAAPNPAASFGPASRATPTLGQALLTASREETGTVPGRVLLILIPRAPQTFSLLR